MRYSQYIVCTHRYTAIYKHIDLIVTAIPNIYYIIFCFLQWLPFQLENEIHFDIHNKTRL